MDASVQPRQTARRSARVVGAITLAVMAFVLAIELGERANLVDPIPILVTFAAGAAGFTAAACVSLRLKNIPSAQGPWRRTLGLIAFPIFGMAIGTFLARAAVEAIAFAGLAPPTTPIKAVVESNYIERNGTTIASVSFGSGTRQVDVVVNDELYDKLDAVRSPGRDCLSLTVQTGRWGLRRIMLPRRFFDAPLGEDRYLPCNQSE